MFAWWIAINPLTRKLMLYGAALLAISYAFLRARTHYIEVGVQQGRVAAADELLKQMKAEQKAQMEALQKQRDLLADTAADLQQQSLELNEQRQSARDALNRLLVESNAYRKYADQAVANIPAGELVDTIRAQSAKLAAVPAAPGK